MDYIKIIVVLYLFLSIYLIIFTKDYTKTFIFLLAIGFPIIDFLIPPGKIGIKLYDALCIIYLFRNWKNIKRFNKHSLRYFTVFFVTLFASSIISNYISNSILRCVIFSLYSILYISIILLVIKNGFDPILKLIYIIFAWNIIFVLGQLAYGEIFTVYSTINPNMTLSEEFRFSGTFQDPQKFGQFGSIMFFLLMYLIKSVDNNFLLRILLTISFIFIIISGSRSPFIGLTIGIIYMLIRNYNFKYFFVLLLSLVTIKYFEKEINELTISKRFNDINNSTDIRRDIWNQSLQLHTENPFMGIGIGNYQKYASSCFYDQYWETNNGKVFYDNPESGLLLLLIEIGIIGFSIFILGLIVLIRTTFYNLNSYYLVASILSWLIGMISVYSISDKKIVFSVTLIASLLYLTNIKVNNNNLIRE